MAQLSYSANQPAQFAGMKADSRFDLVESFLANTAIEFGRGLARADATSRLVKYVDSTDNTFRGISIHQHNEDGLYLEAAPVNTLRQGMAWVQVDGTVNNDASAYVSVSGGTGLFTETQAANLATGGFFRSTDTTSGGLALLEINIP